MSRRSRKERPVEKSAVDTAGPVKLKLFVKVDHGDGVGMGVSRSTYEKLALGHDAGALAVAVRNPETGETFEFTEPRVVDVPDYFLIVSERLLREYHFSRALMEVWSLGEARVGHAFHGHGRLAGRSRRAIRAAIDN
ncbi:MAG: hypothetical protein ACTSU5_01615 [Promethearchaeota archaeon]